MGVEVRAGDVGTIFEITIVEDGVPVDVSAATTKEILFRKPDRSLLTKTASFTTDGTDGKIRCTMEAGELVAGPWQIQGRIELPAGSWSSEIGEFYVHSNL